MDLEKATLIFEYLYLIFSEFGDKPTLQVYAKKPFNLKILKTDIDKYMDSDEELVKLKSKVDYIQTVIDFLDRTLKQISNRGFQIKNAIDWRKFTSGAI